MYVCCIPSTSDWLSCNLLECSLNFNQQCLHPPKIMKISLSWSFSSSCYSRQVSSHISLHVCGKGNDSQQLSTLRRLVVHDIMICSNGSLFVSIAEASKWVRSSNPRHSEDSCLFFTWKSQRRALRQPIIKQEQDSFQILLSMRSFLQKSASENCYGCYFVYTNKCKHYRSFRWLVRRPNHFQ